MPLTARSILHSAARGMVADRGAGPLRCMVGGAVPLFVRLVLREPSVSAFGGVAAGSVDLVQGHASQWGRW